MDLLGRDKLISKVTLLEIEWYPRRLKRPSLALI